MTGGEIYNSIMTLRSLVALVAVAILGVLLLVGALTDNYYWTAFVPVAYAVWIGIRDHMPDEGRRRIRAGREAR
jgi:hypothetical protein